MSLSTLESKKPALIPLSSALDCAFTPVAVAVSNVVRRRYLNVVFILKNKSGGEEKRIFLNTEETCLRALKAIEGMYQNVDKLSAQGLSDEASEFKIKGVYYHNVIAKSIERDTIKVNNFTDNQKKELSEIYHRLEKWFN